jgi:hypothetical protein
VLAVGDEPDDDDDDDASSEVVGDAGKLVEVTRTCHKRHVNDLSPFRRSEELGIGGYCWGEEIPGTSL